MTKIGEFGPISLEVTPAIMEFAVQQALIGLRLMPHMLPKVKLLGDLVSLEAVKRFEAEQKT